jgi:hypothetical protein
VTSAAACVSDRPDANKIQLIFVQTAESLKADGKTLRLVNVGQQTRYVADRSARIARHRTCLPTWTNGKRAKKV